MTFNGVTCRMSGEWPLASRTMRKNQQCACVPLSNTAKAERDGTRVNHQVPDQLEALSKAGTRLNEVVNALAERLQHVLRVEPEEKPEQPMPAPELVPLADRLRIETGGVVYAAGRIEDLLSRLEV